MESIPNLQQKILRELPSLWEQSIGKTQKYISHTWHLPRIELSPLIPGLPLKTIGFWHSPGEEKDILALLPLKFFGDMGCFNKMEQILQENPQLTFFGGQHFSCPKTAPSHEWAGFGHYHYFLPALCLETNPGETRLTLSWPREMAKNSVKKANFIYNIKQALQFSSIDTNTPPPLSHSPPTPICSSERWNQIVDSALEHIRSGKLEKVVLARKQIVDLSGQISPRNIFEHIRKNATNDNYEYYLQTSPDTAFISMTPEKLFELQGEKLRTEALAGTRPRGQTAEEDRYFREELLTSPKERHEHNLVVSFLKNKLKELSIDITIHPIHVLKLPYVQHLKTTLEGIVSASSDNVEKLISHLHPTPAVAGWPSQEALNFLSKEEVFQRGLYASPIGIIQKNYAHFATAIRSALVYRNKLHIYAGSGIVKNSRGIEEWKETWNKMQTFRELF